MRTLQSLLVLTISLLSLGCAGGGGFCPINIPSCCYDTLFGCGTFDLPAGCSCSDYGYMSRVDAQKAFGSSNKRSFTSNRGLSGTWSGIIQKENDSCGSFLKKVNGVVRIHQTPRKTSVYVPGFGSLKGARQSRGFRASGTYRPFMSSCKANVAVKFTTQKRGIAATQTTVSLACPGVNRCSATYTGTVQKNS
jgi:hypothetical protein